MSDIKYRIVNYTIPKNHYIKIITNNPLHPEVYLFVNTIYKETFSGYSKKPKIDKILEKSKIRYGDIFLMTSNFLKVSPVGRTTEDILTEYNKIKIPIIISFDEIIDIIPYYLDCVDKTISQNKKNHSQMYVSEQIIRHRI